MTRFLLGFLVGAVATASYLTGQARTRGPSGAGLRTEGRVDELSSASRNPPATPLNAGDGTPSQTPRPATGTPGTPLASSGP